MKRRFSILLLSITLAALLLLSACNTPASDPTPTPPATTTTAATTTTVDRDTLQNPDLTDIEREIIEAAWDEYKANAEAHYTINNVRITYLEPCGDAYVLFITDFKPFLEWYTSETIVGNHDYEFRYSTSQSLKVYRDGKFSSLQYALDNGVISEDELSTVWNAYKTKHSDLYDSNE